ncbi:hypothetical protein COY28_03855, partial [Candidatus Woesearchaeota archaeon CG_4_10_14_0_2_um_filter_57_5]
MAHAQVVVQTDAMLRDQQDVAQPDQRTYAQVEKTHQDASQARCSAAMRPAAHAWQDACHHDPGAPGAADARIVLAYTALRKARRKHDAWAPLSDRDGAEQEERYHPGHA